VLFSDSKLRRQRCPGRYRRRHSDPRQASSGSLFAALPTLFAVHQFIEGFVWLGLDGILSPKTTHNMGAAFMLYAQGLLPFLLPLSVLLFEPDKMGVKRYAFTSLWCAYAAVASVIILAYFWKSHAMRPFKYLEAI
jgi:hypothetical protein